jgi:hypothetical protein
MTPNDKAQKRKEANRIRSSNLRKNKETPEQADIRRKKNSLRSAERRKRKLSLDNISQKLNFNLEHEENFPYISKMVNNNDVIHRAFHHIMKTKIGSDEYLTKDIREQIGLNVETTSTTKCSNPLLKEIHQSNICVCCDRFIIGTEELNWISKTILLTNKKGLATQM